MKKQAYIPIIGNGEQDFPVKNAIGVDTSMTFATKKTPEDFGVGQAWFSDLDALFYSDGSEWRSVGAEILLLQSGIPVIRASNGSIGNNGALTLGTALPSIYTSCYIYVPADAIAVGVDAGIYYAVMSSTTVGVLYNNVYTGGYLTIPASPTAFATTGPGAYTQTTGDEITLISFTIPGGSIGKNGAVKIQADCAATVNANSKTISTRINNFTAHGLALATFAVISGNISIKNRGVENKQQITRSIINIGGSSATGAYAQMTINTSSVCTITLTANVATATDNLLIEGISVLLTPKF